MLIKSNYRFPALYNHQIFNMFDKQLNSLNAPKRWIWNLANLAAIHTTLSVAFNVILLYIRHWSDVEFWLRSTLTGRPLHRTSMICSVLYEHTHRPSFPLGQPLMSQFWTSLCIMDTHTHYSARNSVTFSACKHNFLTDTKQSTPMKGPSLRSP